MATSWFALCILCLVAGALLLAAARRRPRQATGPAEPAEPVRPEDPEGPTDLFTKP